MLRRALELGVNHIDTAQFYGDGVANQLIHDALAPYPEQLVLVSKVGAASGPDGALGPAQRPEQLRAAVESNLSALGVDRIDVVNMRRLNGPPGLTAEGDQLVDLDSQLAELAALRDEGKIGAIGLSSVTLEQLRAALPVGIVCVQNAYSLIQAARARAQHPPDPRHRRPGTPRRQRGRRVDHARCQHARCAGGLRRASGSSRPAHPPRISTLFRLLGT